MNTELECLHYWKRNGKNNTNTLKVLKPPLEVDKNVDYYELQVWQGERWKEKEDWNRVADLNGRAS